MSDISRVLDRAKPALVAAQGTDIQAVVLDLPFDPTGAFLANYPEFPDSCRIQFTFAHIMSDLTRAIAIATEAHAMLEVADSAEARVREMEGHT